MERSLKDAMPTQAERGETFARLHAGGCFVVANPWDAGSARLLALLGFPALAGTGAGYAYACGLPDFGVGGERLLAHVGEIAAATGLPFSADLENGFGDAPETVAATIRAAAAQGAVGGSIEDRGADGRILPLAVAVDRIRAAAGAVRALPFRFMLTGRAENYLCGRPDLADTIARLQAYQEAGADVLFAPGLRSREEIAAVVGAVDRPVNVIMGFHGVRLTVAELAELGVRRVSLGASLARAATAAMLRAAAEVREHGSFGYAASATAAAELNAAFGGWVGD